jgi:hypothetical protein
MRVFVALASTAAFIAAAVYWNFGAVSPCGVLRETARQRDGFAAVLPDSIVDLALAGQYGALSPGRCFSILMNNLGSAAPIKAQASRPRPQAAAPVQPAPQATPQRVPVVGQDPLQRAAQVTMEVNGECRTKRLRGELPTHLASAQCSNPTMIAAFQEARYRYMDLIEFFAGKRLEVAAKIDRGELTEQQAQLETNKVYANVQAIERQRDRLR